MSIIVMERLEFYINIQAFIGVFGETRHNTSFLLSKGIAIVKKKDIKQVNRKIFSFNIHFSSID
jgi:hypothetical protein